MLYNSSSLTETVNLLAYSGHLYYTSWSVTISFYMKMVKCEKLVNPLRVFWGVKLWIVLIYFWHFNLT